VKAYRPAIEQVREILAGRSQAQPLLEARDVWDLLNCWPVPSVRTVRRYMEQIRDENGHHGQADANGHGGQIIRQSI